MKTHKTLKNNSDLEAFYNADYYDGKSGALALYKGYTFDKLQAGFKSKIVDIQKHVTSGKLLDVGCAKGYFVKMALDAGYDAYGVDFSKYAIRSAQKIVGNRAQHSDIEGTTLYPPAHFNIITCWDCLEHLKDPEAFLMKSNTMLRTGGYIFFTTLNYASLMSRLMPSNWRELNPLHINYTITPKLVKAWLQNAKFRPVEVSTFMLDLKPLPSKLRIVQSALSYIVTALTPFLEATNLGDLIWCTAKKDEASWSSSARDLETSGLFYKSENDARNSTRKTKQFD